MTELDIMKHAKDYLDKLARGVDPLTDREVPDRDVVKNERISRCLSYVSDVLQRVIDNGGIQVEPLKNSEKGPFALTVEERAHYRFDQWPVPISAIAQQLNELGNPAVMQRLKTTSITKFLMQSELLIEEEKPNGSKAKRPTEAGRRLGISTALRTGQNGEYTAVLYSKEAQQFILDNLDAIIAINAAPLHENQGKPWELTEDDYLRWAAREGVEVKDMSAELKRTRAAIRARLEKLGLTGGGERA